MTNFLGFRIGNADGAAELIPTVDETSLVDLVANFEAAGGMTPAGSYAGLIPAHFNFGDLSEYYLGRNQRQWPGSGRLWLLGCNSGEVGCWPLEVTVTLSKGRVMWSAFRQPHRPQWNYDDFGPFEFDVAQYRSAVGRAVTAAAL